MAEHEGLAYSVSVHRDDSPVDHDPRNEREGSRESDHDDRDRRRRGGGYERDLRRENRRYAPYPSHGDERSTSRRSGSGGKECRVYVWNLPYSIKWQDLKDFMKKVGDVGFVEIIEDINGKSKVLSKESKLRKLAHLPRFHSGSERVKAVLEALLHVHIVEFKHEEDAKKAIKELHGTEFSGRTIHIREDHLEVDERRSRSSRSKAADYHLYSGGGVGSGHGGGGGGGGSLGNLGGLLGMGNANIGQGLNYKNDPLSCTVFVSNLDYKVTWQKLKDTFRGAGHVIRADINLDSEQKSKGFGTVQYETTTEAINAVSMFHGQILSDRALSVRLDRNAPIMQQLGGLGMNNANANVGRGPGAAMNPMAVMQLLQNLQGLSALAQLTSNLGALTGGGGAMGGGLSGGVGGGHTGMSDSSGANPLAALGGLGMLSGALGLGGGSGAMPGPMGGLPLGDSGSSSRQVFVRNLPWRYSWQDLKDKFKGAGKVVRADIMTESSGRSKGCGTVIFETAEEAAKAISMFNGTRVDGREIDVRMDRIG